MRMIGELSDQTGIRRATIRYYEEIGLLPDVRRASNGYRLYGEADVERVNFIRRSRSLGFTLDEIAAVLAVRRRGASPCDYVLETLDAHLARIESQIDDLVRLRDELLAMKQATPTADDDCICQIIQR